MSPLRLAEGGITGRYMARLLTCGSDHIAIGGMEREGRAFRELSLEGEIKLDDLHTGVLKLERTFKVDTIDIDGLDDLGTDSEVY